MFAELLGKEAGYCKGKGGSMHIADPDTGNLGANAIVAGSAGIATGAAFSAKRLGNGRVAVCFFGEGALGQGVVYEVMNMAAIWKLPVIYVCENNLYNEYTHMSETTAGDPMVRAAGFGVLAEAVDGQDARAVYAVTAKLVERARRGEGPGVPVGQHVSLHRASRGRYQPRILSRQAGRAAVEDGARSAEDHGAWLTEQRRCRIRLRSIRAKPRSRRKCEDGRPVRAGRSVSGRRRESSRTCMPERCQLPVRELTLGEAVREALAEEMRRDPRVFILGEDVAEAGTTFKVLTGLVQEFGPDRVLDTPISEPGFTGIGVGAAMTGLRPVVDIMFGDFAGLIMDQMANQAAKVHYMSGGRWKVPMVLRTTLGATRRSAAQHSQSLHAWFCHIPGPESGDALDAV